jgi:hypothetical protein
MKGNQEILDEFGKKVIENCLDGSIRHFNSLRAKENPPILFKEKSDFLKSLNEEQYNAFKKIIRSNVELVLFEFLKIFEEHPQFKILYEEDTRQVDLTKISEMLKAEPIIENGWIKRFSTEIGKDEGQV